MFFRKKCARGLHVAAAAILIAIAAAASGVSAGQFEPIGDSGGVYSFTGCEKPPAFQIAPYNGIDGNARIRAHNKQTRRYNDHVAIVNAYLNCIAEEAGRDLHNYYGAVSATLDAEQSRVLDALEGQRKALGKGR